MLVQGDTHGNTNAIGHAFAQAQRQQAELVIQVGDFGYGWKIRDSRCAFTDKVSRYAQAYDLDLWWIDGNHENFDYLEAVGAFGADEPVEVAPRVWYVPRGTLLPVGDSRCLFVGGAYSVDKPYRTPHQSWWPQEELTGGQVERALQHENVDVIFSHDVCNTGFRAALSLAADGNEDLDHLVWKNDRTFPEARRNRMALEAIYEHHHPRLLVNGHYHSPFVVRDGESMFIGLDMELQPQAFTFLEL